MEDLFLDSRASPSSAGPWHPAPARIVANFSSSTRGMPQIDLAGLTLLAERIASGRKVARWGTHLIHQRLAPAPSLGEKGHHALESEATSLIWQPRTPADRRRRGAHDDGSPESAFGAERSHAHARASGKITTRDLIRTRGIMLARRGAPEIEQQNRRYEQLHPSSLLLYVEDVDKDVRPGHHGARTATRQDH